MFKNLGIKLWLVNMKDFLSDYFLKSLSYTEVQRAIPSSVWLFLLNYLHF